MHIVQFLHDHMDRLPRFGRTIRVGLEPGCSVMRYADLMREVVEAMGCEVVNRTMGCCGKNIPVSGPLMAERETECEGAEWIVVACPMCLVKFDSQPDGAHRRAGRDGLRRQFVPRTAQIGVRTGTARKGRPGEGKPFRFRPTRPTAPR